MISNSFKTQKELLIDPKHLLPVTPTIKGYVRVLTEAPFFSWLKNSVIITTTNTLICLFTSSLVGFVFSKYNFKWKNFLFWTLLASMMVPAQVTMIPSFILLSKLGFYNKISALIVPAFVSAFGIFLCRQFIDEIPRDIMESAKIEGASNWTIYFRIILPMIQPALGALAIFTFLANWNDYLGPLIMLSSVKNMTLPLAITYFNAQRATDRSATMAAAALIMVPVTLVFLALQKFFIKGIAMTGMK
jgi:multiple sugar transport system permease protein